MHGTILIADADATRRLMLELQLGAAWYRVVMATRLCDALALARRVRLDLILVAMTLPDGDAPGLRARLHSAPEVRQVPMIALTAQNDRAARLKALAAGIDDALCPPVDDRLLQARIRSLIRTGYSAEGLRLTAGVAGVAAADTLTGLSEPAAGFAHRATQAQIALLTTTGAMADRWRSALNRLAPHHRIVCHRIGAAGSFPISPCPDAAVIELASDAPGDALPLLAGLRAGGSTRDMAVIAVPPAGIPREDAARLAAAALDRGAHDVTAPGFDPEELVLRLAAQLRRKARAEQLHSSVQDGMRAALHDPLTGLYNRRHALPHLREALRTTAERCGMLAVMLADLDRFKAVNDRHGHPVGDAVLIAAARRLRQALPPDAMIARYGGDEFLIVIPCTGRASAEQGAAQLCQRFDQTPIRGPGLSTPVPVTLSIGLAFGPCPEQGSEPAAALIRQADRALYAAKDAGRNQISVAPAQV
ncbi:diguanylate cyclase domain-containing protein [Antarcticimicrobium sediminis]|uniref:diguanylate cyclase n=1 Tax=Antarcticimicrobium sediminis TaxID=2546227 RepID=A0A4R5F0L7_9RHOB|nr:diguanylate cyclase [Antarcticimicrobium sediminis]TDE41025.1 diguanylate cyclase [Antarcticimicrobium sediminis]